MPPLLLSRRIPGGTGRKYSSFAGKPADTTLVPWLDAAAFVSPSGIYPMHSHYMQAWRSWYEARPATALKFGLGLNFNFGAAATGVTADAFATLAAAGVKNIRMEVSWNLLDRATNTLLGEPLTRLQRIATEAAAVGVRPIILVNAHHGVPNPPLTVTHTVTALASSGATTVTLDDVTGLTPHYSGIGYLTDYLYNEVLFTAIDTGTNVCTLSKPLPVDIPASTAVTVGTFLFRPFSEPGHADFDDTCLGWVQYVRALCTAIVAAGVTGFDIEIWNELSFGSNYLYQETYYDPPLFTPSVDNPLAPGERLYEIASRTVAMLQAEFPTVMPIWGFSSTNFFGAAIVDLPVGTGAFTYHPYSFLEYDSIADEPGAGFAENYEGYAPTAPPYTVNGMPEAALTWLKTENLVHHLKSEHRLTRFPSGATSFKHYQTEHGIAPTDYGITDETDAWRIKTTNVLRAVIAWLHRGIDVICIFTDVATGPTTALGFNMLTDSYASTPALDALGRLMTLASGAQTITSPISPSIDVGLTPNGVIFAGDGGANPDLTYRDVLAIFPFQMSTRDWLVPIWIMTRDITAASITPATATVRLTGLIGTGLTATAQDVRTGTAVSVTIVEALANSITVSLPVSESPVVVSLELPAAGGGQPPRAMLSYRRRRVA